MGLGFNKSDARWSYSGFNSFRTKLAKEVGLDLDKMKGFSDDPNALDWPSDESDPIMYLLNHSDCDGDITAEQCKLVGPRLRELIKSWDDDDFDKIQATRLADGMDLCAEENVSLEFI